MYERERERIGEGERDARGDGERAEMQGAVIQGGSTVAPKQQGSGRRAEDPVGWGLNPVSFSQELGVLDLAPCPLRIFASSPARSWP